MLSSLGCANPVLNPLLLCSSLEPDALESGLAQRIPRRSSAGFGQATWCSPASTSGSTRTMAYDFSVLGNTPITFPIEWDDSKIPGFAGRVIVPNIHGLSAFTVFSSVAARFFTPQVGGAGATPSAPSGSSASTTTRSSTRPPICNISPGSAARGWASTGAMTAAWWPGQCPAPWPGTCANRLRWQAAAIRGGHVEPAAADQQFQGGLESAGRVHVQRRLRRLRRALAPVVCPASQYQLHSDQAYPPQAQRMTTIILRAFSRATCSTFPLGMTTCSTETNTNGARSSPSLTWPTNMRCITFFPPSAGPTTLRRAATRRS